MPNLHTSQLAIQIAIVPNCAAPYFSWPRRHRRHRRLITKGFRTIDSWLERWSYNRRANQEARTAAKQQSRQIQKRSGASSLLAYTIRSAIDKTQRSRF